MAETRSEATLVVAAEGTAATEAKIRGVSNAVDNLGTEAASTGGRLAGFDTRLKNTAAGAQSLSSGATQASGGLGRLSQSLQSTLKPIDENLKGFDSIKGRIGQLQATFEVFSGIAVFAMVNSLATAAKAMYDFATGAKEAAEAQKQMEQATAAVTKELDEQLGSFALALALERDLVIQRIVLQEKEKLIRKDISDAVAKEAALLKDVDEARKASNKTQREANELARKGAAIIEDLPGGGMRPMVDPANTRAAAAALKDAEGALKKFREETSYTEIGSRLLANAFAQTTNAAALSSSALGKAAGVVRSFKKAFEDATKEGARGSSTFRQEALALGDVLDDLAVHWRNLLHNIEPVTDAIREAWTEGQKLAQVGEWMQESADSTAASALSYEQHAAAADEAARARENAVEIEKEFANVMKAQAESTAAAALSGIMAGQSAQEVIHAVAKQIAMTAGLKAAFELAEGLAATGLTFGAPNPASTAHFAAAAKYAAVAAAAGAIAGASGAGGGGASAGGGGGGGPVAAQPRESDFGGGRDESSGGVVYYNNFSGHFYDTKDAADRALGARATRGTNQNARRRGRERLNADAVNTRQPISSRRSRNAR